MSSSSDSASATPSSSTSSTSTSLLFKASALVTSIFVGYNIGKKIGEAVHNRQEKCADDNNDNDNNNHNDEAMLISAVAKDVIELPENIDHMLEVALAAALAAGAVVRKFVNDTGTKNNALQIKAYHNDICTLIDKQCEELILNEYILKHFPKHQIIAEESTTDPTKFSITDDCTWFIDPIDGTTNFLHGLPLCAICIGLRFKKRAVLGVVHLPVLNETYFAIARKSNHIGMESDTDPNCGAFLIRHTNTNRHTQSKHSNADVDVDADGDEDENENKNSTENGFAFESIDMKAVLRQKQRIFTNRRDLDGLKNAIVLSEGGFDRGEIWSRSVSDRVFNLLFNEKIRGLRMFGSCAINMCYIACGKADVYFEGRDNKSGPKPWDFTAAEVIVNQAGGFVGLPENIYAFPFDCTKGRVLCCNSFDTAKYITEHVGLYDKISIIN